MRTLNLEILAHVDAGKTSLTERLLHAAGVIDEIGRVDDGSTQTDTLTLERQRGITIKSDDVSFILVNLHCVLLSRPCVAKILGVVYQAGRYFGQNAGEGSSVACRERSTDSRWQPTPGTERHPDAPT